ncbi:MAG: hypothetical protein AB7Q04_13470 [Steroidobacteraceae bacterium]
MSTKCSAIMRNLIVSIERPAYFYIEAQLTTKDLDKAARLKGKKLIEFIDKHAKNRNWRVPSDIVNCEPMWDTAEGVG